MAALELDDPTTGGSLFPPGYLADALKSASQPAPPSRGVGGFLRDQAINLGAGAVETARSTLGGLEAAAPYLGVDTSDPELERVRQMQADWRQGLGDTAESMTKSLSPQGQAELSAKFIPGEGPTIWDSNISTSGALVSKAIRSAPSVVASILGTVIGGPGAGLTAAAAQTAGQTYNDIRETIEKMPSEELAQKNPLYAGYLSMMPETQARERLLYEVGSNKALIMGTITAATSKYLGIEGRIADRLGGRAVGSRIGGAVGEATQEGIEQIAQSGLTYAGQRQAGSDKPFDWHDLANQTLESMTIGGMMGGTLGGGHHPARPGVNDQPIAADAAAAVAGVPLQPTITPEVTPPGPSVVVDQKSTVPGHELDALDKATKGVGADAGVVQHVDTPAAVVAPAGLDPAEAAALHHDTALAEESANSFLPEDMEPSQVPPPVPPVPDVPVVSPAMGEAIGANVQSAVQPANQSVGELGGGRGADRLAPAAQPEAGPALTPVPESPETLAAQFKSARDPESSRQAVLVTPGERLPKGEVAQGFRKITVPEGRLYINAKWARENVGREVGALQKYVDANGYEALIGKVAPVADTTTGPALVTRDADGTELSSSIVPTPETAVQQAAVDQAQFPEAAHQEVVPAQQAIAQRVLEGGRAVEAPKTKMPLRDRIEALRAANPEMTLAEATQQAVKSEPALKSATRYNEPRMGKLKKAQIEAGAEEVLSAKELAKKQRQDELAALADRVRAAQAAMTEPPTLEAPTKQLRAYAQELVRASEPGDISLANLRGDVDPALRHLKAAVQIAKGAGNTNAVRDFMVNDLDLRKGGEAVREYAQAQTTSGVSLNEDIGSTEAGTGAVQNKPEQDIITELDRRQPRRDVDRIRTARDMKRTRTSKAATIEEARAAAASMGVVAGAPTRTAVVETRRKRVVLSPQERAAITRRGNQAAAGTVTAKTEGEAAAQLQQQRTEENKDILARRPEDEAAARELTRVMGTRRDATVPLGQVVRGGQLFGDGTGITGVHRLLMTEMAGRLRKLVSDVPVRIVDDLTFNEIWGERNPNDPDKRLPHGFYDPNADEIVVRFSKLSPELIVHEGTHAAYQRALDARPDVKRFVNTLMDAVEHQYLKEAEAAGQTSVKPLYGLENEHEFIAWAFTNPSFQELLQRTPADATAGAQARGFKRALISAWDVLIRNIKKTLYGDGGPTPSVLEQAIRATQQLDMTATEQRGGGQILASRSGGPSINVKEALEAIRNAGSDRGAGASKWWRRLGLNTAALDQMNRIWGWVFDTAPGEGNPLQRVYDALAEQTKFVEDTRGQGERWAQRGLELRQKHGSEVIGRAYQIGLEASMVDGNLGPNADNSHFGKDDATHYQAKAVIARLNQEFATLPKEVQDHILEGGAHYRAMQNEMVRAVLTNFLQEHNPTLSVQAYAQLTDHVMNGKLTEEDRGILDDDGLFKALQQATGLRVLKGIYFPAMRFGNHVVRTLDKLDNLHGGKIVETDKDGNVIVEWREPKDAAARAGYRAFAQDTQSRITSVGKRRYAPDGTILTKDNAVGQTHDVAYRARVQLQGVHFFESGHEAARFIREAEANQTFGKIIDKKSLDREELEASGQLTNTQFAAIMSSLDRRSDLDPAMKGILQNALREAAIRTMPGSRVQHRSLARRGVLGASEDLPRVMVKYSTAASNYLGKLRYLPKVREALVDMRTLLKNQPNHVDTQIRNQVLNELVKRIDRNVVNPKEPPRLVKDIMTLSFMDKLFSPMYNVINGMQVHMVTYPVLTGLYGPLRSLAAINRAYKSIGAGGLVWSGIKDTGTALKGIRDISLDTSDLMGSIKRRVAQEKDGAFLGRVIAELERTGQISPEAGFELASAVAAGKGPIRMAIAKVERIARQMPIAVEAINRAVSGVAAARLGLAAGMTEEQAIAHAKDIVDQTQGNYNTFNQPRAFNNPLASPALQFKKYAQLMTALSVDMVRRAAFKTGQERRVALKQIGALLGVQIAMAGAMGLPGLELLKTGFMLAAALGMGDGWDDMERRLRKLFEDSLGKTPAELITRGVISRGIAQFIPFPDISNRVSLSDMWLFGEPKSNDRQGAQAYLFNLVGGAPASLLLDWMDAARMAGEGRYADAFINTVPVKFVADTAKAVKGRASEDLTNSEAVIQALGARSVRMAEKGEEVGGRVAISKKLEDERKQLTRQYLEAGSRGELLKIKARILAHNKQAEETHNNRQRVGTTGLDAIRAKKQSERDALQGR